MRFAWIEMLGGNTESNMLPNGHYTTKHGSEMWISGEHGGRSRVEFDWLEEPDACIDCQVEPYERDGCMHWHCDVCGGGFAELQPVPPNAELSGGGTPSA